MRLLHSTSTSPQANAALEEHLFRQTNSESVLLFYRNRPSVLCGRNQNLWQECDPVHCERYGIALLRRITGGGTVYHDEGNLNVALIQPRRSHSHEKFTLMLSSALAQLGLSDTRIDSHGSIFAHGGKLCGTAIALTGAASLVHGCLLVTTQLAHLRAALALPATRQVTGHGVASRRVPVTRLAEHLPGISVADVIQAIVAQHDTLEPWQSVTPEDCPEIRDYQRRFASPEWTHKGSSSAPFALQQTLTDGRQLCLCLADGIITQATLAQQPLPELMGQPLHVLAHFSPLTQN